MRSKFLLTVLACAGLFVTAQAQWTQLGTVDTMTNSGNSSKYIEALCTDASGNVYAAGRFLDANANEYVAKWNGTGWSEVGTGSNALNANDYILALCTDPSGNLYAAGQFTDTTGNYAYVAKWNGTNWAILGSGQNTGGVLVESIRALCSDASGNIYAAGQIANASISYIVTKFDGTNWSQVGPTGFNDAINAMAIDGSKLYVGGVFTNGGLKEYVAEFDGTSWSEVGSGAGGFETTSEIDAICVDGSHNVYAAGEFTNGNTLHYVTKWNGTAWAPLGGGTAGCGQSSDVGGIYALCADAAGNVYAGGGMLDVPGHELVAKWNGTSWSNFGNLPANDFIKALTANGTHVYAGGAFRDANADPYVAEYSGGANGVATINTANFSLVPNPTAGLCEVTFGEPTSATITLTDLSGKTLGSWQADNETAKEFSMASYTSGLYLVRIEAANAQTQTIKVVKD